MERAAIGAGKGAFLYSAAVTVECTVIQRETPAAPLRTCIGCRKRELAVELLRVVAVSMGNGLSAVAVDTAGRLPGRGAWLHVEPRCLQEAIRRRAFARALRITGSPDTSVVVEHFTRLAHPATEQVNEEHEHTVKSR